MFRIGHGYDIHAFGGDAPLMIGGVEVDYDRGLLAHSDGDVLLHSIADAIIGALALGDLGTFFPDTSPVWKDADSKIILRKCYDMMEVEKYSICNLDCTIIAEAPKFSNYILQIRDSISSLLQVDISCVSVKATTNEGLGAIGAQQGIAVMSNVLLTKKS